MSASVWAHFGDISPKVFAFTSLLGPRIMETILNGSLQLKWMSFILIRS